MSRSGRGLKRPNLKLWPLGLIAVQTFALGAQAQSLSTSYAGEWFLTVDRHGTRLYQNLQVEQHGSVVSGTFDGDKITGDVQGSQLHLLATDSEGEKTIVEGRLRDGVITGEVTKAETRGRLADRYPFSAIRRPAPPNGPPNTHEFTPTVFYRQYSAENPPALVIAPGDTVHTTTVDAGGIDGKGVARVLGGNPETGPFYVQSAMPGDTLVIHLLRLRLNRDYAISDNDLVARAVYPDLAQSMKDGWKEVRWRLDRANGQASIEHADAHLLKFQTPTHPMLGCIATAPSPARGAPPTGDSGSYGGNLDFNEIAEGATVYLPVSVPGALLYLGDAHALQGDGELNGNALETSMDVTFSVEVIPGREVPAPRVETADYWMAIGLAGSLDDALKAATSNMVQWLSTDFHLTTFEAAEVLGAVAEYKISEAADRNAGIVLKIKKARLDSIAAQKAN